MEYIRDDYIVVVENQAATLIPEHFLAPKETVICWRGPSPLPAPIRRNPDLIGFQSGYLRGVSRVRLSSRIKFLVNVSEGKERWAGYEAQQGGGIPL